jgi:transcriptional regulator of heat shock response
MTSETTLPQDLTPRQRTVLGLVVREFINTAEPVGSHSLVELYDLGGRRPPCVTR